MNNSQTLSHPLVAGQVPDWASGWGQDEYGVYADFSMTTGKEYWEFITQRMRWIPQGKFRMGSPAEEHKRRSNEVLHQVIISNGYWLAETCCTQELWTTVMDDNPSKFEQPQNPVENVSWEGVQEFLSKLSHRVPFAGFGLPTESQWEYVCRAGTETPFSFGNNITTEQANFDGNFPYREGEKGICRQKTVPVRSLPCNPWGLFEMHGNVWEWCSDWYGDYPTGEAVDPVGPQSGLARVIRGGSLNVSAHSVRSAYRYGWRPSDHFSTLGFRCTIQSGRRRTE